MSTGARGLGLGLAGAAVVAAALSAGCGGQPAERPAPASDAKAASTAGSSRAAASTAGAAPVAQRGTTVKVVRSQFGRILADGRGQALYLFSRERGRTSRCYGACAVAWPPVPARGRPMAGAGARASLIGTTRRRDGTRQITYRERPVYYYVGDSPGRVLCQNVTEFGGVWRVLRADGMAVR